MRIPAIPVAAAAALCLVQCLLPTATEAQAEKRVALVIGNGEYKNAARLLNPKNDAEDVAAALRRTGFDVIVGLNLDKAGMDDAFVRFARSAREADVAMFDYSGHAMQFSGVSYLMPVDAKLTDEADLRRMARLDEVVADLQNAKNLRILVLDSCRDNPLAEELKRSIGRTRAASVANGLAKIDSPQGMIVAYATQAGRTADDGQGRNSPYTGAFLKHIEHSEEIGTVFRRISTDVYNATKRTQLPELSLSVIGEFYLKGKSAGATQVAAIKPGPLSGQPFSAVLKAKHSGRCMDVAGGGKNVGRPVWQFGCNNSDAQRWDFVPDGAGFFILKARHSGLCFDVTDSGKGRGVLTWQQDCNCRDNQKFKLSAQGDDYFHLQPKHSNMCIDVFLGLGSDQAPLIQWDCHGGDNQKWRVEVR